MRVRILLVSLVLALTAVSAGANGVVLTSADLKTQALDSIEAGPDSSVSIYLNPDEAAVVTAYTEATAGGDFRSYLNLEIQVDGVLASKGQSYVPVGWAISHHVNATAIVQFPGLHQIRLRANGEGLTAALRVKYSVLVVKK